MNLNPSHRDIFRPRLFLAVLAMVCGLYVQAGSYLIQVGDMIGPGIPSSGAGNIDVNSPQGIDTYSFAGSAGERLFFQEISLASAFNNWLRWELKGPGNESVFNEYFDISRVGRITLPSSGNYSLRVFVGSDAPSYIGDYSFRIRTVPNDQSFGISIGTEVSDGLPGPGAGNIEAPGTEDRYSFSGSNKQIVFFEEFRVSPEFEGWLRWRLVSPSGETVFDNYFNPGGVGRIVMKETGTYFIRVWVGDNNVNHIGTYSFTSRILPPDQSFVIQLNQTVSPGVPGAGAGAIEYPKAEDVYTFPGTKGDNVFFEELSLSNTFEGWLRWIVTAPNGDQVVDEYFSLNRVGRRTLPATGTYSIRFFVGDNNPSHVGTYSFRISGLAKDLSFPIPLGFVVSAGLPSDGAGQIEKAGSEDLYSFKAVLGQHVWFRQIQVDKSFEGWLRWEVLSPTGRKLVNQYFVGGETEDPVVLDEAGTYTIRLFVGDNNAAHIGAYSFQVYSKVTAQPDQLGLLPNQSVVLPFAKLLANDIGEKEDVLSIDLPSAKSVEGVALVATLEGIRYTPKPGFVGRDSFDYHVVGLFGGGDTSRVTVSVFAGADAGPSVVNWIWLNPNKVRVCLLSQSLQTYHVEGSENLKDWISFAVVETDASGAVLFDYATNEKRIQFFRFRH